MAYYIPYYDKRMHSIEIIKETSSLAARVTAMKIMDKNRGDLRIIRIIADGKGVTGYVWDEGMHYEWVEQSGKSGTHNGWLGPSEDTSLLGRHYWLKKNGKIAPLEDLYK